jgi:hypothetical protein
VTNRSEPEGAPLPAGPWAVWSWSTTQTSFRGLGWRVPGWGRLQASGPPPAPAARTLGPSGFPKPDGLGPGQNSSLSRRSTAPVRTLETSRAGSTATRGRFSSPLGNAGRAMSLQLTPPRRFPAPQPFAGPPSGRQTSRRRAGGWPGGAAGARARRRPRSPAPPDLPGLPRPGRSRRREASALRPRGLRCRPCSSRDQTACGSTADHGRSPPYSWRRHVHRPHLSACDHPPIRLQPAG